MLGHVSPQMTARYATIHDATVRAEAGPELTISFTSPNAQP